MKQGGNMLNNRQQALVNLLERYTFLGIKLSRNQIQQELPSLYERTSVSDYHDKGLHLITKDIHAINEDTETDALVLSTPNGIWLATEKEVYAILDRERSAIIKRLVLLQKKVRKAKANNQLSFDVNFNIFTKETLQ